jgi:TolB protein
MLQLFPRRVRPALASALLLLAAAMPTQAQFRVEISGVGATQVPVAVARFRDESQSGQSLSTIVRANLERSGVFRNVPADGVVDEGQSPVFAEWRGRAADALVGGSVTRLADGRFDIRFKVWDVVKGVDLGGQSATVYSADLRLAAHRISDYVYEKLTGEKGVFSTRIAYVTKGGGRFSLRVADADGEGGQVALTSNESIISPAWSPDGKQLAYVSFENQKAVVYMQDVASGSRRVLANFKGSNSAPAWAPNGQTLALTLSRDGGSQIYVMGRDGSNVRRVTNSNAIDTEPVFSHDGRTLYFISPSLSPDGRTMAYIARLGGAFRLHTMDLASGVVQALTDTSDDESPSFAPNGRMVIYASRAEGRDVLMTTTLDGKIKARLVSSSADVREPMWGPFGR